MFCVYNHCNNNANALGGNHNLKRLLCVRNGPKDLLVTSHKVSLLYTNISQNVYRQNMFEFFHKR